jgi:hypothetical protein
MINVKEFIEDVIKDLAENKPLDSVVSKVQVISRFLKNDKFKEWVDNEFTKGYTKNSEVPTYRKFFVTGVNATYLAYGFGGAVIYPNQQVPLVNLGAKRYREIAEITIKDTISIIQQSIIPNENIHLALHPYETSYIQELLDGCQIMNMYKVVSNQQFQNIIDQTKAILIDFFLELDEKILENEIDFNVMNKKEEIERIVNNTIHTGVYVAGDAKISDSNIVGGTNNKVRINTIDKSELINIVKQIEILTKEIDVDRIDIADAILSIHEELNNKIPRPKFLKTAFISLKAIGTGVIANKITPLVDSAIEIINKF